jgi:N-acyl-D-aspartate/D-glutamate deacylase
MSSRPDIVIRGGTVVDGTGAAPFEADVALTGDTITEVGRVAATGRTEIDARGRIVTPGFVDIHTHYDGQAVWSVRMDPSSWHGVSTAVMGNCGVGFAPCGPENRDRLVRLMEGVEDIPEVVLAEGLSWEWDGFPGYLDLLASRRYDLDLATQVPHSALRVQVMGERATAREPATADDIRRMAALAAEAISVGALGFSTSRTLNHRSSDGSLVPTLAAEEAELSGIAAALRDADRGVLQAVADFTDVDTEFAMLRRVAERSGRPLSFSLVQTDLAPRTWERLLELVTQANADGVRIRAQVCGRAVGLVYGLELSLNPFSLNPSYKAIAHLPFAERLARMREPAVRAAILAERPRPGPMGDRMYRFDRLYPLDASFDYEPSAEHSLAARAERRGIDPAALAYDMLIGGDGTAQLYRPLLNYFDGDLENVRTMLEHPQSLIGLGDGGAHFGAICDSSLPTFMLTHWIRDRRRGARLSLPGVVRKLSRDNAEAVGLLDRGTIAPGYRADLNVIDLDRLALHAPEVAYDLPAHGRRLVQRANGYVANVVGGMVTYREGVATGELPGRLVRGPRPAPR